jgi:hypothetical protein
VRGRTPSVQFDADRVAVHPVPTATGTPESLSQDSPHESFSRSVTFVENPATDSPRESTPTRPIETDDPAGVLPFACGTFAESATTGRRTVRFAAFATTVPSASTTVRITASVPWVPVVNVTSGMTSESTTPV